MDHIWTIAEQVWRSPSFPLWVAMASAGVFGIVLFATLLRAQKSVANAALAVITLLSLGAAAAATLRGNERGGGEPVRTAAIPAMAPAVPALACLDGLAGDNVEQACEKLLFASADVTAAAVSYTAAQLARVTASAGNSANEISALRRTLERDRYGLNFRINDRRVVRTGSAGDVVDAGEEGRCQCIRVRREAAERQDNCVELFRLHVFDRECVVLDLIRGHIEADVAKLILRDKDDVLVFGVDRGIRDFEGERRAFFSIEAAVAFTDAVAVFIRKTCFVEQSLRAFGVVSGRFQ